jgi:hypothetical protein
VPAFIFVNPIIMTDSVIIEAATHFPSKCMLLQRQGSSYVIPSIKLALDKDGERIL